MATRLIETGKIDIEAIKDAYPLAQIVEPYVALKRRKDLLEGLCPFHEERTPSFKIYDGDQHYHCFGCGAHGDLFDFLEHIEGLGIRAAAEKLTGGSYPVYSVNRIEELRAKRLAFEAAQQARSDAATQAARERWIAADPNVADHPYLTAKGIGPNGARLENGTLLLIPLVGDDGKLQSLQSIDRTGRKLFVGDAPVTGGLFVVGGKVSASETPVLLCEGYATACSLHEATGYVVVCAFNSGNLAHVAGRLRARYPDKEYVVCGDDDRFKAKNPGRDAAYAAASILGCEVSFPVFADGSAGTDFNDMAADYEKDAVKDLIIDGVLPSGEAAPPDFGEVFQTLSLNELEALPPPTYLIEDLVPEHGTTIVYGDPGTKKSFIVLDMGLRLAYGMDWHGVKTKRVGVLYIAGEGKHGLGKRVKGWRKKHGMEGVDAPFKLLPVAVKILDAEAIEMLKRTINAVQHEVNFRIGLVIIDTVSRSMAGADENKQDAMSQFVDGVTQIQNHFDGAALGVHHSGKDKEKGMRGSSVLLGGVDTTLKVTKEENVATIVNEKQKDDEEAQPITMTFEKVEWAERAFDKPVSTLVPFKSDQPAQALQDGQKQHLTIAEVDQIFGLIHQDWDAKTPWSVSFQAKRRGRYLPSRIAQMFRITEAKALEYAASWQAENYLRNELCDTRNQVSGLRVLKHLER